MPLDGTGNQCPLLRSCSRLYPCTALAVKATGQCWVKTRVAERSKSLSLRLADNAQCFARSRLGTGGWQADMLFRHVVVVMCDACSNLGATSLDGLAITNICLDRARIHVHLPLPVKHLSRIHLVLRVAPHLVDSIPGSHAAEFQGNRAPHPPRRARHMGESGFHFICSSVPDDTRSRATCPH